MHQSHQGEEWPGMLAQEGHFLHGLASCLLLQDGVRLFAQSLVGMQFGLDASRRCSFGGVSLKASQGCKSNAAAPFASGETRNMPSSHISLVRRRRLAWLVSAFF